MHQSLCTQNTKLTYNHFQGNPVFDAILIKIDAVFISLGHAGDGGNSENSKFPLIGIVSKIYQEIPKSQSHFL